MAAIVAGASKKIRLLIGSNRDEALLFFPPALVVANAKDPNADAPIAARELAQLNVSDMNLAAAAYKQTFPDQSPFARRLSLLTAEEYWIPTVRLADTHAAAGGATFMYRFDESASLGPFAGYVVHASELGYTWRNFTEPFLEMVYGKSPSVPPFAHTVHATWASFIKGGRPTHRDLPAWTPYDTTQRQTMVLKSTGARVEMDPAGVERKLWDGLL